MKANHRTTTSHVAEVNQADLTSHADKASHNGITSQRWTSNPDSPNES